MLVLNVEAVLFIKDRPSENLRWGGGGGGGPARYMFTATKKIILIQGKINQGLSKVLTKNIYADQSKYPHPSHNFSNVLPLRTI